MAYEIENFGPSSTTGLRAAGAGEPNFPDAASAGSGEELGFTCDLILDPQREASSNDPVSGWDSPGQRTSEV